MLLNHEECQLVLIDFQEKLIPMIAEGDQVLKNAQILAQVAKKMRVPVWGTEQALEKLGMLNTLLKQHCQSVLVKTHFSACVEGLSDLFKSSNKSSGNARSLPKHLQKQEVEVKRPLILLAGVEAHICLLQTALDLLEAEYEVWVITDACGSRSAHNRDAAFDRLAANGAELVTTEMVLYEWLESSEHEHFCYMLDLIK